MQHFIWYGQTIEWEAESRMLRINTQTLQLSQPQAIILLALLEHGPQSYGQLSERLYQQATPIPRTLEKLIERLRKRLQTTALSLYTIRGFGYIALPSKPEYRWNRRPTRKGRR